MTDCTDVNCLRPECIDKCGPLQWVGNLSPCKVRFEYQTPGVSTWHSIGEYSAGDSAKPGPGSLWLPRETTVRAVDVNSGKVLQNWGRVGVGLPSLFVDNTMCAVPSQVSSKNCSALKLSGIILGVIILILIVAFVWVLFRRRRGPVKF